MANENKKLFDLVAKDLQNHKWKHTAKDFEDGEYAIDTDVASHSDIFRFYEFRLLFERNLMRTIYYLPLKAPEKARTSIAEYLMRINGNLMYGRFLINFKDGALRYECVFSKHDILADLDDVMERTIDMMRDTIDRYANGLVAVVSGAKSAEEAFIEAVKPKEETPPAEAPTPSAAPTASVEEQSAPELPEFLPSEEPEPKKKKGSKKKAAKSAAEYSIKGLNLTTKVPLKDIIKAVKKFRKGKDLAEVDAPRLNILLSGAPGSGKTAFVKHLAEAVGAPLKILKASDIIGRYTGETERAIASAFESAKANNEILFLDEIDSFLQDRTGASRSWEVTQVNELLQQMESFEGVLIGATNFVDNLDKAVLRRFTYKIKLDYLTDEGKNIFFGRYFKTKLTEEERKRLEAIDNLTPGDFRTVKEELFYLEDKQNNDARLEALEAESAAKGRVRAAKIGFAA